MRFVGWEWNQCENARPGGSSLISSLAAGWRGPVGFARLDCKGKLIFERKLLATMRSFKPSPSKSARVQQADLIVQSEKKSGRVNRNFRAVFRHARDSQAKTKADKNTVARNFDTCIKLPQPAIARARLASFFAEGRAKGRISISCRVFFSLAPGFSHWYLHS